MAADRKRNIALFLGAGASKAFQYPLTREILSLIVDEIKTKKLFSTTTSVKAMRYFTGSC